MNRAGLWSVLGVMVLVVCGWVVPEPVSAAQDYLLGPEDVIAVSVYLHPELERTVTIGLDGTFTFPPVGEIKGAGLTTKQLGDRIAEKLSNYLRQTTAVTVTVNQYFSRSVYVTGAVARPGRYGFERIPNLVDVIGQAGGALPGADLSAVQIVRKEGSTRRTLNADVASSLQGGSSAQLPELKPGDTIVVPSNVVGGQGGPTSITSTGIGVLGEVNKPGLYPAAGDQDLWSVLAAAGGLSPRGDLSKVRVLSREGATVAVTTLNLRDVLRKGGRAPYVIKSGDVVYVETTGSSQLGRTVSGLQTTLQLAASVLQLFVLQELLDQERNP